jgi:RNA polymerase sigma-70 factor (ECF subfamily)
LQAVLKARKSSATMSLSDEQSQPRVGEGEFCTTHWSVVIAAGRNDTTHARAALEKLCQKYWYPLYVFVRRLGHSPHDAEDLVQSFFTLCIEKQYLGDADQSKGRFRSFLLIALKRFLANEWDKARTLKRGAAQPPFRSTHLQRSNATALEPAERLSADRLFERRWALTLLDNVLARLREEQIEAGQLETFEVLKDSLTGGSNAPYAELAERLGKSEGAVKVAVHRLRQRYRELLETEIANTVASPEEVAEERRYLLSVLTQ